MRRLSLAQWVYLGWVLVLLVSWVWVGQIELYDAYKEPISLPVKMILATIAWAMIGSFAGILWTVFLILGDRNG